MPFYEYECASCKFYTELLQKVSDPPLRKCPSCGRSTMKKLVSAPNFRLKGGGWYETDFKSDQEKKRNLAVEKEPEAKSTEDSKTKADDAKPADAKTDAKPTEAKPAEKPASESRSSSAARSTKRTRPPAKGRPRPKAAAKRRARR